MRTYKRLRIPGGTYFFTLTLAERHGNDLLTRHVAPCGRHLGERLPIVR